jgi:SMC interacting uncharacterized protein involved in chromosome segregation
MMGDVMATTVEERIKEMDTSKREVEPAWDKAIAKLQKDITAPEFKKIGDIKALAHQFDVIQNKFEGIRNERDDAERFIESGWKEFAKLGARTASLQDQLKTLFDDARTTVKSSQARTLEDKLNNWEELLKEHTDLNKETKNVFDEILKVGADRVKMISDTGAMVQAALKSGNSKLAGLNTELNGLENQIRSAAVKYQKAALDMNRKDIADAARGFLKVFGN